MISTQHDGNEGNLRIALSQRDFSNPSSKLTKKPSLIKRSTYNTQRVSPIRNRDDQNHNVFYNGKRDNSQINIESLPIIHTMGDDEKSSAISFSGSNVMDIRTTKNTPMT